MKVSVTYQAIVEEGVIKGRLEETRRMLLLVGEQQIGKPAGARASIEAIHRLNRRGDC
jgi:hypothetical protein